MKKNIFFPVLLLVVFNTAFSQTDPKADEVLKAVSAKYKSYKTLSATFKLVIDNEKEKTKDNQAGKITIKENKYKLEMEGQEVISDGKTIWTFLKEENEVQINDATSKKDAISPSSIFTIYEKGFRTKYIGEKAEAGKTLQQIELVPEDAKKPYFKIQLFINKADKYVTSARVLNRNGINLYYSVDKFSPDAPAEDALFTFDKSKHPGVEVVDLR